jgi:hypothetical protein
MTNWYLTLVAACLACGGGSHSTSDAPRGSADASTIDAAGSTSGSGQVTDESGSGIADAMVCVINRSDIPCVIADIDGNFKIDFPDVSGSDLAFEATATGFLGLVLTEHEPTNVAGETSIVYPSTIPLFSESQATALLGSGSAGAGFTFPTTSAGFAEIRIEGATAGTLTGATATLTPSGSGPVYLNGLGTPDPKLTSTTTSGGVLFGNLAPGLYTVTAIATGKTCSVSPGGTFIVGDWPPLGSGTVSLEVASDALTTNILVVCE